MVSSTIGNLMRKTDRIWLVAVTLRFSLPLLQFAMSSESMVTRERYPTDTVVQKYTLSAPKLINQHNTGRIRRVGRMLSYISPAA